MATDDIRDPRIPEHYFPAEVVAAAKAGWFQYSGNLSVRTPWELLPIQSQDDWILIWAVMHKAYKEAGGQ